MNTVDRRISVLAVFSCSLLERIQFATSSPQFEIMDRSFNDASGLQEP